MNMTETVASDEMSREALIQAYLAVRHETESICAPLEIDDFQIQSITETSPPKWHLAHVTWFFETFLLAPYVKGYEAHDAGFAYLFNSYYETVGRMHPRPRRGLLSRPTVKQVLDYRAAVDERMVALLQGVDGADLGDVAFRVTLGLNHEQQHQELLFMDIKHNFWVNPLKPAYRQELLTGAVDEVAPLNWLERDGGQVEMGHEGSGFAFDNETPRHPVLLQDHRLASRTVTNGEFLEFMADGGYGRPELWMADGWALIRDHQWEYPLYWQPAADAWSEFTLGGMRPMNPDRPVCHLSFYEADAFARWRGKRLPSEAELESVLAEQSPVGNFADSGHLHPVAGEGHWFGNLWEWTASPYTAYPGFRPLAGSMGEYNGKFMCNQMVLRGGCCATPAGHVRPSYRNFFYPHDRWAFTGLRLAEDA
ncbi:MAG: ergothioneine biosynthesis protein EgtB [Pseudomonadota bacterium]